jgi:hypothetical protein
MNTLVYALRDFFEFTFKFMPSVGSAVNLIFMLLITVFCIYWIVQMFKNPDKVH